LNAPTNDLMLALQCQEANALHINTVPKPSPGPGQLLIKVHATSINPSDILNSVGGFFHTTFPRIPGRDYAGTVVAGPEHLLGSEVFGTSGRSFGFTDDGAHAQYCVVAEDAVAPKPKKLSFIQAASVGVPFTTASLMLRRAHVQAHEIVLVIGATGNVGSAAVQIATVKGCTVLTASRGDTTDINLEFDPELEKVFKLTKGHGVDAVLDTTGDTRLLKTALGILGQRGRLAIVSAPRTGDTDFTFDLKSLYRKEHSIIGSNSLSYSSSEMAAEMRSQANTNKRVRQDFLEPRKSRYVGAGSAISFPLKLSHDMGAVDLPRLHSYAWNAGTRPEPIPSFTPQVANLVRYEELHALTSVYFDVVHPVFGVIDKAEFTLRCAEHWMGDGQSVGFDALVGSVCALGSLFAGNDRMIHGATEDFVVAWILRSLYLRSTTRPHASWMSTCSTMHIIEAVGLHRELGTTSVPGNSSEASTPYQRFPELRRKIFWTAKSLNLMFSWQMQAFASIEGYACTTQGLPASISQQS
ncbi:GroES-like protein, partial [Aureobasidium melanogenum]